jgi:serine/threonine-protein kinase
VLTRDADLWIYDLASGRGTRLTRDGVSQMGVWNPQGMRIAYSAAHGGDLEAWVTSSDGSGEPEQLTTLGGHNHVDSWSPDGRLLTVHRHGTDGTVSIVMVPMEGSDRAPRPFLDPKIIAEGASFSPEMRFVSYLTTESGQREIYIRPYPGPGGQVTVSVGGGREPTWMPNGEVFYRSLNGDRMFAVSAPTAPALTIGPPVEVFRERFYVAPSGSPRPQYDVTADGKRFLIVTEAAETSADRLTIVIVQNWLEELKRLLPVD